MTRGDRDTAGQKLAPNEWATALKRLTNESGTVLTDCSAGMRHAHAISALSARVALFSTFES